MSREQWRADMVKFLIEKDMIIGEKCADIAKLISDLESIVFGAQ